MNASFISKKKIPKPLNTPWKHYVVDDFLPTKYLNRTQKRLCSIKEGYQKRENDVFDLNFMFLPDLSLAKIFLSDEFQNFLQTATGEKLKIFEKGLVQLRLMTASSPAFEPHVDNQDERSLVCIWYLSPNWTSKKGGELVLLTEKDTDPSTKEAKIIAPLENRLVFFFSDDTNWHSVNKVHNWNRYTIISEWIVTP